MAIPQLSASLPSGIELRYQRTGGEFLPAGLLLHGYSDSSFSFHRVLPYLTSEMQWIIPDQRGHGHSSQPENGYELIDFAQDALGLLDVLEIPKAAIVGHSMGAFVAQHAAVLAPERVTHIVLIGSGATLHTDSVRELGTVVDTLSDPVDPDFIRAFQYSTVHRPIPDAFMEQVLSESSRLPARVWKAIMAGFLSPRADAALSKITCPVLMLSGEHDAVFPPADQDALARALPDAASLRMPDVGHTPHWEVPEIAGAAISRFLRSSEAKMAAAT